MKGFCMKTSVLRSMRKTFLAASLFTLSCAASKAFCQDNAATEKWFNGKTWLNGLPLTPHKTIDQQEFKKQYEANSQLWNKAFAYLKETNLAELKAGKYPIDGDNVYALVTEGFGRSADTAKWEDHQQYIDIHHVITGKEAMGLAPVTTATVITPYDSGKDIGFYKANGTFYESGTNTFFIVFPKDAHLPGIKIDGYNDRVKKIVIKVKKA